MNIPYGIHDYKTIKTEGYLFIDKTGFINKLEMIGRYLVFLRPRRFGKSLFTSMLYYYYDINSRDIFDLLFSDTYAGWNKTKEVNRYYILKFDFSGINTEKDVIKTSFYRKVKVCVDFFIAEYDFNIDIDPDIKNANEYLESFLQKFKSKTDKQIYLIIDEYDHFANNVLAADISLFHDLLGKDGFVRSFYEVFKTYAGVVIARMFITGVTPITLDSLTSGFNNVTNVSKEKLLNEMMGFTEDELSDVLDRQNIMSENLQTLRENYNGYLFHKTALTKVYNSNMVLYYLRSFAIYNTPPDNLTDPNIISDYSKITSMFDLYSDRDDKKEIIHKILNEDALICVIKDKFNIKMDFNRDGFISLLFYLGLLTIECDYGDGLSLKTPNYIIKNIYYEYYYHYLNKELEINLDVSKVREAVWDLSMSNRIEPFVSLLEKFLQAISGRDFIKFDEKYIKLLMLTYLRLSGSYLVKSEYETGGCYIDIALLPNVSYKLNNYFIFELKYIRAGSYSEKLLEEKKNEAINQINKYAEQDEMKNIKNLRKYVLVFVHDECRVVEEICT